MFSGRAYRQVSIATASLCLIEGEISMGKDYIHSHAMVRKQGNTNADCAANVLLCNLSDMVARGWQEALGNSLHVPRVGLR